VTGAGAVFVLDVSVAVRWWLRQLPYADAAVRFLVETLASRQARVFILDGLRHRTLDLLAADLASVRLQPEIGGLLYDDVARQMDLLNQPDIAQVMDPEPLARAGFMLAGSFGIPLYEAETAALAEVLRLPLLVADADEFAALDVVAARRPALRLLWLPEFMAGRGQA
jgi:hypothetical protein